MNGRPVVEDHPLRGLQEVPGEEADGEIAEVAEDDPVQDVVSEGDEQQHCKSRKGFAVIAPIEFLDVYEEQDSDRDEDGRGAWCARVRSRVRVDRKYCMCRVSTGDGNVLEQWREEDRETEEEPRHHCAEASPRTCLYAGGGFRGDEYRRPAVEAAENGRHSADDVQPASSEETRDKGGNS